MKIAICVNGRAHEGGVTTFINSLSDGLRGLNHEVDIVTIFGISKYREVRGGFVARVDKFTKKKANRTFILYNLSKSILLLRFAFAYRKNKYDVLFAIDVSVVNATRCFAKIINIPVFLSVHSSIVQDLHNQGKIPENSFVAKFIISEEAKAYGNAKGIIANSQYTSNYIKTVNKKHASLLIIRNMVDDKKFFKIPHQKKTLRKKYNVSGNSWVILFVGRVVERKGVRYLALAFSEFVKTVPDATLILVGKGEDGDCEKQTVLQIIDECNLQSKVILPGAISNEEIGEIYNLADTLVVPSVTHRGLEEPLGISALEGMATGIPVIASDIGGLREIIRDKVNGLLVPEGKSDAISNALFDLKSDPKMRQQLIENALADIKENYTSLNVAERTISFFKSVCPQL
jgi:glycosyltransferase involved in cell wall biosynthesis